MRTPKLLRVLSLGLAFLLVSAFAVDSNEAFAQETYYVDTGGSDVNDGLSPTSSGVSGPFRTITRALTAADEGDTISIEAGTYSDIPAEITVNNITFVARPGGSVDEVTLDASLDINVADGVSFTGEGAGTFQLAATRMLTLDAGTMTLADNVFELPATGNIIVEEGDIAGSAPVFGTTVNVTYQGPDSRTAGLELPADMGDAASLNVAFSAADQALTLSSPLAVGADVDVNGNSEIDGTLLVENDVTFTGPGNAGTLDVNSGNVTLDADLSVDDVNIANDSAVDFDIAGNTLTIEGSFERLGGTFSYGAGGTLAFVGDAADATFSPGPNFEVGAVTVDKDGQTLSITDDVDLTSTAGAFSVANGTTVSINDEQLNIQAAGTVDVDGELASLATGGVFFNVAGATITGDGTYSNITVVTADGNDVLVDGEVDFAGTLALVNGGLTVGAGEDISPSGASATVVVNLATAGQDITGSFDGDDVEYDLTYSGALPALGLTVGSEFAPNDIRNVTFNTSANVLTLANLDGAAMDEISGNFFMDEDALVALPAVADDLAIAGALTISDDAILSGGAAGNTVTLTGDGTTHSIVGTIPATTTLIVDAENVTINGSTVTDTDDATVAIIPSLTVADGASATVTNLQEITGDVMVGDGAGADATLMLTLADEQTIAGNVTLDGAMFTLGSDVNVAGDTDVNTGTFAFGSNIYTSTGTDFDGAADVMYTATVTADGGWLRLNNAGHSFGLNGEAIPGLQVSDDVTLDSDVEVTEVFVEDGGTVTNAGNDLTLGGALSTDGGTLVTGAGNVVFNTATLTMGGDATLTAPTEIADAATLTLASDDDTEDTDTDRTLNVTGDLLLDGTLSLDDNDLALNGTLTNDAGAVDAVNGGVLQIDGGNDIEFTTDGTTLAIPNLSTVAVGPVTIGASSDGTVRITDMLELSVQIVEDGADDALVIAEGVEIIVNLNDPLADEAAFDGPVSVTYTVAATTGEEIPADGGLVDLTVMPGGGAVVTIDEDVTVSGTLTVDDSELARATADDDLTLASGATLALEGTPGNVDLQFTPMATSYFLEYGFDSGATVGTFDEFIADATVAGLTMNLVNAGDQLTIDENRSVNDLTLQSGIFNLDTFDLTVNGDMSIGEDGDIEGTNAGTLIFEGTEEQTLSLTSNLVLGAADYFDLVFSNTDGTVLEGASIAVTDDAPTVTFNGLLAIPDMSNFLQLYHETTSEQGYVLTDGGVFGTVRKEITGGTTGTAPANRLEYPLADSLGNDRSAAFTFNNPSQISSSARSGIFLSIDHVMETPGGRNNLPLEAEDNLGETYQIARKAPFYWVATSTTNLSPSISYDVEFEAESYEQFEGESIQDLRVIRRQAGAETNEWIRAAVGPVDNDNFAISATYPVGVARNAVGALIGTPGTIYTFGLEANLPDEAPISAFGINAGENTIDLAEALGLTGLGTGNYTYTLTSGDETILTVPAGEVSDPVELTGVAPGTATLTVNLTDEVGDTRTYTVDVTVNEAFAFGEIGDQIADIGETVTLDLSTFLAGGSEPFTFAATSDDDAIATATVTDGSLAVEGVSQGVTDITVTVTDATGAELTRTFSVTVTTETVDLIADQEVFAGDTVMVDLSDVFPGTAPFTYTVVSADDSIVMVDTTDGMLRIVGMSAFADGETVGPVEVTVSAADVDGLTTVTAFNVQVLPVYGDAIDDGIDGPTAANASLALQVFLELEEVNAIAQEALDVDNDGAVTPFDASLILQKAVGLIDSFPVEEEDAGKGLTARGVVQWGDAAREGATVTLPLELVNAHRVMAFALTTSLDKEMATVDALDASLPEGWTLMYNHEEDGTLRIAAFGANAVDAGTLGTLRLTLADANADVALSGEAFVNNLAPQALDAPAITEVPDQFALKGNYPNPFNPSTTIQFDLPQDADVTVQVFDMLGREVMTVASQQVKAGANRALQIDAGTLASGTYLYRIVARTEVKTLVDTGKMMLVK